MTAEELSELYPYLYHVTEPNAWPMIQKYGLLSTLTILELFKVNHQTRETLTEHCRPEEVLLKNTALEQITINDNKPMNEKALLKCLDDGLQPKDWLRILNSRVFFWSNEDGLNRLLNAKMNQNRSRLVLTINTLLLAQTYLEKIEICPINSGSTIRKPARRGLGTFTPLAEMPYRDWQKKRGKRDKILEVTVLDAIPDIDSYLIDKTIVP